MIVGTDSVGVALLVFLGSDREGEDFTRRWAVGAAESGAGRCPPAFSRFGVGGACATLNAESVGALFEASCETGVAAAGAISA